MSGERTRLPEISASRLRSLMTASSLVMLAGLLVAAIASISADSSDQVFSRAAPFVGLSILLAIAIEAQGGLRNLVRIDLFMLLALYLLTYLEFLFDQPSIAGRTTVEAAQTASLATLLGYGGLVIGRHFCPPVRSSSAFSNITVTPRTTFLLLIGCFFIGYLYIFISVNFNIFEAIYQMSRPRFSQPWTRGRYGSLSTLINEVGLLVYLVPPLGAAILARMKRYSVFQRIVTGLALGFVFYDGFAGGTRNIFLTHIVTFSATFALVLPKITIGNLLKIGVPAFLIGTFGMYYMAEIRTVGLNQFDLESARTDTLSIDMNLVNVANIVEVFPDQAAYLGLEVPYVAAVRPIPRAIWPGKPEGLSFSIEDAVGVGSNMTLSATFIGELWMAGGYLAVAIGSLLFGASGAAWNRVGSRAQDNLALILFASGFFPAGLLMRGFLSVVPTLLPVIALYLILRFRKRSQPRNLPAQGTGGLLSENFRYRNGRNDEFKDR